jgi:hypothetical protein
MDNPFEIKRKGEEALNSAYSQGNNMLIKAFTKVFRDQ